MNSNVQIKITILTGVVRMKEKRSFKKKSLDAITVISAHAQGIHALYSPNVTQVELIFFSFPLMERTF